MSVKNIRSGISLYDRALFIGTLFKEDYALYDKTIGELNGLSSLDEAVDYLLDRKEEKQEQEYYKEFFLTYKSF